jgi:hypothetical protein
MLYAFELPVAMEIGFVGIYPIGNLRSVFLVFFPHLLKFSPVFITDLSLGPALQYV